jgi:hypothetical protein
MTTITKLAENLTIKEPYSIEEIVQKIESDEYSAELMLQHLIINYNKLGKECHYARQCATDNANWFDCLTYDLSQLLKCDNKPTEIFKKIKQILSNS